MHNPRHPMPAPDRILIQNAMMDPRPLPAARRPPPAVVGARLSFMILRRARHEDDPDPRTPAWAFVRACGNVDHRWISWSVVVCAWSLGRAHPSNPGSPPTARVRQPRRGSTPRLQNVRPVSRPTHDAPPRSLTRAPFIARHISDEPCTNDPAFDEALSLARRRCQERCPSDSGESSRPVATSPRRGHGGRACRHHASPVLRQLQLTHRG